MRARARAVFVARERIAQAELEQLEQLEERQGAALNSPSTPAIERELTQLELKDIEGELQRIVLGAGLPNSPVRQQLVLAKREERLVDVAAAEKATAETADTAAVL